MIDVFITYPEWSAENIPALYDHVAQFEDDAFTTDTFRQALWIAVQCPERSTLGGALWDAARHIHIEHTCNGHSPTPFASASHEAFDAILRDALRVLVATYNAYDADVEDACHPALLPVVARIYG